MNGAHKIRSLTRRTISITLTAQILCALLLCGAALLHEWHTRFRAFDVRIQGRSDSLLGAIQDAENPNADVKIDPTELNLPADDVFAVYNRGEQLLGTSANAPAALTTRGQDGFRNVEANGIRYRLFQREGMRVIDRAEYGENGLRRPVTILYASPKEHVWHEILEAVRFYLITIVLIAALSVLLVAILLRRALQPLSDLATEAASLSAPALYFEPPASVLQVRELRPLAHVLGETIERLREAFAKEHRFLGNAAHELKTAVAVVRSSVQLLMLKQRSIEEYEAGLDRILEDNQRVESLVGQMLQLARLEEKSDIVAPATDLSDIAASIAARLQGVAEERGVSIRLKTSAVLLVRIYAESAEILMSNLLLNAIQHSRPHSSVLLSTAEKATGEVVFEVVDEGMGIGADALPHIFDRFYREDVSRSRETGGTGLGLSICKSIVDAAHGSIEVQSSRGRGTTVITTFMGA